jgi:two-component system sensor histidine kinase FlrB
VQDLDTVTILPSTRQKKRRTGQPVRQRAERTLVRAFTTFTQAAGSLEKAYCQLKDEVARLNQELECANAELTRSLEENKRVRGFLTQILEGLPVGVLVFDADVKLQVINPESRRLLCVDPSWLPEEGMAWPSGITGFLKQAALAENPSDWEWASEGDRAIRITQAQVNGGEGGEDTVWLLRETTQEKRIAAENERAKRNQALAEIATVLAHEIRNPLGSLDLFAGLLADSTPAGSEASQWISHIQAGLRTLSATVNNVLQFHGQPTLGRVPTRLDRLMRETVDFLAPLARQRGMQIRLQNRAGKVTLDADANRLQQVFLNLALNAFRAMSPGGWLIVTLAKMSASRPEVQIDFEDQGMGIPEEAMARMFDPGFTTHPGSPGLGLSVCKKVMQQHDGAIYAHSEPRLGSTFTLTLPVSWEIQ